MQEPNHSTTVAVAIALITVAGSLGGAWITTGSTFDEKFEQVQREYRRMSETVDGYDAIQARADEKLRHLDQKMSDVEETVDELNRRLVDVRQSTAAAETRLARVNDALQEKRQALTVLEDKAVALDLRATRQAVQQAAVEHDAAQPPPDEG